MVAVISDLSSLRLLLQRPALLGEALFSYFLRLPGAPAGGYAGGA